MKRSPYPVVIDFLSVGFLMKGRRGKFYVSDYTLKMCEWGGFRLYMEGGSNKGDCCNSG